VAAAAMAQAGQLEEKPGTLIGRIGAYVSRVEPVRQVRKYIRGSMSDLPRKNCSTPNRFHSGGAIALKQHRTGVVVAVRESRSPRRSSSAPCRAVQDRTRPRGHFWASRRTCY
jgi:hypothetical protein